MRQDFKEPVKWFDDDDEEALGDYEELETIADVDATQKRLTGRKKYIGLTLAEIDKHAKTVSLFLSNFLFLSFFLLLLQSVVFLSTVIAVGRILQLSAESRFYRMDHSGTILSQ